MERTGWFASSHALVDRLHENVVWGCGATSSTCPPTARSATSGSGWTGDIQVFAPTASFLYDVHGFLTSWLTDLELGAAARRRHRAVRRAERAGGPAPAGGGLGRRRHRRADVLHERYGDERVLADQLASMQAWTDVIVERSGERHLWEGQFQFADWLDPSAPPERPAEAKTHPDIVATAYVFRSADLTARAAALLGETAVAEKYAAIAERVRRAFLAEYVTPAGRMVSDAQTGYALAIMFDLVAEEQRQALGDRLAELVRSGGYTIGTGFVGTPIVADALSRTGHLETATRLLTQTACPSWLYPVTMGATTIWERWDSMLPDGTINPGEMTSFNHYALGAVADWLHRVVAGLAPATPGYGVIRIAPQPLTGFDFAEARHLTPYGPASVRWDRDGDQVRIVAEVPPNSLGRGRAARRAAAGGRLGPAHLDGDRPGRRTPHGHRSRWRRPWPTSSTTRRRSRPPWAPSPRSIPRWPTTSAGTPPGCRAARSRSCSTTGSPRPLGTSSSPPSRS